MPCCYISGGGGGGGNLILTSLYDVIYRINSMILYYKYQLWKYYCLYKNVNSASTLNKKHLIKIIHIKCLYV